MVELSGKNVVVVGLGASGLAAVRFCAARGARVVANDKRDEATLGAAATTARGHGAELRLGSHDDSVFQDADVIVLSPGVPALAAVDAAEAKGALVLGEAELALRFCAGRVIGITGTNGKSTVTSLLGEMCEAAGFPTFVGGNLGTPLLEAIGTPAAEAGGVIVVELSSFQLERAKKLRCHVAVLLNVTDDHLDRYASFAEYAAAKGRIFLGQEKGDVAIVPDGDELCLALARAGAAEVLTFGGSAGVVREVDGHVRDGRDSFEGIDLDVDELGIRGGHNVLNACAAVLAATALDVTTDVIERVLRTFRGLPHRMVHVRTLDDVDWFDDSKATNVGATLASLDGLASRPGKVVLIAGGVDKGGSYEPVRERLARFGRGLVLIGEARPLIRSACATLPIPILDAESMQSAVELARTLAVPGDAVLLAPACASFDMFQGYAHRGRVFEQHVRELPEASS
jgi:UDP-N-acetylmuramoylalanine--D-glutamate ligase